MAEAVPLLEEASRVLEVESGEHDPGRAEAGFYLALASLASSSSSSSGAGSVIDAEPALLDSLKRMKVGAGGGAAHALSPALGGAQPMP